MVYFDALPVKIRDEGMVRAVVWCRVEMGATSQIDIVESTSMHDLDKDKPVERWGRKAMGLTDGTYGNTASPLVYASVRFTQRRPSVARK